MKTTRWMLVLGLALLLAPAAAAYDDDDYTPPADDEEVTFTTGYQGSSQEDAQHHVAEYDVVEPNPIVGLSWATSPYDENRFRFSFDRLNSADWSGAVDWEMGRTVRIRATGDGLLHRLDHDPVTNLQAVSEIKVVRSTDLDPGAEYMIRHSLYDVRADFQHPDISWLSWRVGFRDQQRQGMRQVLGTGHCTSCHTTAQGREIDNATTDLTVGLHAAPGAWDLDYQVLSRTFREDGMTPTVPFEEAFRPATPASQPDPTILIKPFNDRLWYQNGAFPVNQVPEVKRTAHTLKARTAVGDGDAVNFTLVRSTTENRTTNLEYDFTGARGRYTWRAGDTLRMNFWAQYDDVESDSPFIDLLALNDLASAPVSNYGGNIVTYEQWMNGSVVPSRPPGSVFDTTYEFDGYTRLSMYDRTDSRLGVDGYWRPNRKNSVRFGYKYRAIDRDNIALADGTGDTESHTLQGNWNYRAMKKLRWNTKLVYRITDNPYLNTAGGLRAYSADPAGIINTPKSPASLQYTELHLLRVADLGAAPSDELRFRTQATWAPRADFSVSANARYHDSQNDELTWTDWSQQQVAYGVNLWYASGPEFQLTLGWDSNSQETDTTFIVPVMDG